MGQTWTKEQEKVIKTRGKSLLVSAAAGSGKTAVLVERILREILDPDRPIDLDRLLVVTFTRAAASQLRERIREAVTARCEENPSDGRLRHQLSLLGCDHIMTMDSFFLMVIRDHYEEISLDPSFRIGDEGELKLMKSDAVGTVLEEAYEKGEEDFLSFCENYAVGNTDKALEGMILDFWESSTSHPYPREWRHYCLEQYEKDPSEWAWMDSLMESFKSVLSDILEKIRRAEAICGMPDGPENSLAAILSDKAVCESLLKAESYDQLYAACRNLKYARLVRKPKKGEPDYDPGLTSQVSGMRDNWKKQLDEIRKKYLLRPLDREAELMKKTGADFAVLVRLADRFEEVFMKAKAQKNILDFSDTAHLALTVLVERGEDGTVRPSRFAREYQDCFEEISIDEYQDSNEVQELLLSAVSRESRGICNRFMVGDVKQSIYRFRMSDPGIFMEKYNSYRKDDKPSSGQTDAGRIRIDLHKNFRSREEVLSAVNLIFRQIMRKEVGGVEYGEEESLYPGAVFRQLPAPWAGQDKKLFEPELIITQSDDIMEGEDSEKDQEEGSGRTKQKKTDSMHAEAEVVAERILRMAGRDPVWDKEKGCYRPVEFRDIVILLRTSSDWANVFTEVLSRRGIPCRSGSKSGYFSAPEVSTILSYLKVLDNPRQDIPLTAVLRSEIGQVTDDELAMIKTGKKKEMVWDCVNDFLAAREEKTGENTDAENILLGKLKRFTDMTRRLRARTSDTPIHQLLWQIFDETGFETLMEVSPGGRQKKANLDMLVEKASAYEKTSYRGLFHFVRYIEKMVRYEVDFGAALQENGSENLVRIMTIHASKGLEFPVVFVSGMGKKINRRDASELIVKDSKVGAGMNYVDPYLRVQIPTLIRGAASERTLREGIGEELRLLYVAMTRAEEKLILTAAVKDRQADLGKVSAAAFAATEKLPESLILGADNYLSWVMYALVRHPSGRTFFETYADLPSPSEEDPISELPGSFRILTGKEVLSEGQLSEAEQEADILSMLNVRRGEVCDQSFADLMEKQLSSFYPYPDLSGLPAKVTVSELKKAGYEEEMARLEEEEGSEVRLFPPQTTPEEKNDPDGDHIVPEFMKEEKKEGNLQGLSGAMRGTAYHRFLADFDFTQSPGKGVSAVWLETMVRCDKITEDERSAISAGRLDSFLLSPLAGRMRKAAAAGTLHRENPFVMSVRAGDIYPDIQTDAAKEQVLIQGTIDAWFEDQDGELVLIDYKTDHVRTDQKDSLVRRYRRQFLLYKYALERLTGKHVREAWLYSLSLGQAIAVGLDETNQKGI